MVEKLGLESAGVTLNKRGYIEVNENYRTSALSITHAAGDGFLGVASTSMEQARAAVCHASEFTAAPGSNLPIVLLTRFLKFQQ